MFLLVYTFMSFNKYTVLCNHTTIVIQDCSITPTYSLLPLDGHTHPHLYTLETTDLFSVTVFLSFWGYYIHGIIQSISLWDWLLWLHLISLRSIRFVVCINNLFLFIGKQYSVVWSFVGSLFHAPPSWPSPQYFPVPWGSHFGPLAWKMGLYLSCSTIYLPGLNWYPGPNTEMYSLKRNYHNSSDRSYVIFVYFFMFFSKVLTVWEYFIFRKNI